MIDVIFAMTARWRLDKARDTKLGGNRGVKLSAKARGAGRTALVERADQRQLCRLSRAQSTRWRARKLGM
jgi:hypothetical protein